MRPYIILLVLVLTIALLTGCIGGTYMKTTGAGDTDEVSGTFRVILYGRTYARDLESAVILDLEGDDYEISPKAPAFSYYVIEGMDAAHAFETARAFLSGPRTKSRLFSVRKILDARGSAIGYDFRYYGTGLFHGFGELLSISYWLMDDAKTVKAVIMFNEDARKGDEGFSD